METFRVESTDSRDLCPDRRSELKSGDLVPSTNFMVLSLLALVSCAFPWTVFYVRGLQGSGFHSVARGLCATVKSPLFDLKAPLKGTKSKPVKVASPTTMAAHKAHLAKVAFMASGGKLDGSWMAAGKALLGPRLRRGTMRNRYARQRL